jgi:hypothetical protein
MWIRNPSFRKLPLGTLAKLPRLTRATSQTQFLGESAMQLLFSLLRKARELERMNRVD